MWEATRVRSMKVLVLADTHNKLPQQVVDLAREADEIWHLGDVCEPTITFNLEAIGPPLTVVRGNCDWNEDWPLIVDLTRGGLKFRLVHIPLTFRRMMSMLFCMAIRTFRETRSTAVFYF